MVALLKQKSKVTIAQKPRVKHVVKNIFKQAKPGMAYTQAAKDAMDKALNFSGPGKTALKQSTGESQELNVKMKGDGK